MSLLGSSLLDRIVRLVFSDDLKRAGGLPFWRGSGTRVKKLRTPFGSSRERGPGKLSMIVEEFDSVEERNARFRELRSGGTWGVSKWSTVRNNKSVWCVARPR